MSSNEQIRVEEKIGYIRNWTGFGSITAVTTWSDKTYTYYLFWGPTINKFIQEEFDPKTPMLVSVIIITADVVTNSLVLYVGDFSYKPISERLAYVASTVIDLDKE